MSKYLGLTGHFCGKTFRRVSLLPRRRVYGTPSRYRKATASTGFEMPGEGVSRLAGSGKIVFPHGKLLRYLRDALGGRCFPAIRLLIDIPLPAN